MNATTNGEPIVEEWRRYGGWNAHLYVNGEQQCATVHGQVPGSRPLEVVTELTAHGQPYGRVCHFCERIWQRRHAPPRPAIVVPPSPLRPRRTPPTSHRSRPAPAREPSRSNRSYPPIGIGEIFGDRTVIDLVRSTARPSDERARWRCVCGLEGESFAFNLRKYPPRCGHRRLHITLLDVCVCGEHRDDHLPHGGACLEDDCDCAGFRGKAAGV